jgi:hypothetical protein
MNLTTTITPINDDEMFTLCKDVFLCKLQSTPQDTLSAKMAAMREIHYNFKYSPKDIKDTMDLVMLDMLKTLLDMRTTKENILCS